MDSLGKISGFSKLATTEKQRLIANLRLLGDADIERFNVFETRDAAVRERFSRFSENTLTAHALPFGIVPNVLIDGLTHHVPAVTEESSVIAAASKAASFWYDRGGFVTIEQGDLKNGQIYFLCPCQFQWVVDYHQELFQYLKTESAPLTANMEKRGGGISKFSVEPLSSVQLNLFKLTVYFRTADSMGANFINSVLEHMAEKLVTFALQKNIEPPQIIMSILSNYTPESFVTMSVSCPIPDLIWDKNLDAEAFARKFVLAMQIAQTDTSRAVTHNKGIMNGVDAVVLATGNDFRAVEASVHAFASSSGRYRSLSEAEIVNGVFHMRLKLPMALGTVGGLTKLHPTAGLALDILQNPSAAELMKIVASVGLASNFAAVASLITSGIQQGHMKLHLDNILLSENATDSQFVEAKKHFANRTVSVAAVRRFLNGDS